MFAIGSMFLSSVTGAGSSQDWECHEPLGACYMFTDDMRSLGRNTECRAEDPNFSLMASQFMGNFVHELCGCQYCAAEFKDYPTSADYLDDSHDTSDEDGSDDEHIFIMSLVMKHWDISKYLPGIQDKSKDYTVAICSKPMGQSAPVICEPVMHCEANVPCPAKEETKSTKKSKTSNLKGLWALLFLPGLCVGIFATFCFYRHRKNQLEEAAKAQNGRSMQHVHVDVPQTVPVQTQVGVNVAAPEMTNV